MRRVRVVGFTLGALAIAGACTATTGNGSGSRYSATTPAPQPIRSPGATLLDSIRAQSIADREGPAGTIRAEFETVAGSRRARAVFHLDDDAYVMVGHIDPDGVVRIVFPTDPKDDGFVKGSSTYRTAEFFAGFNDQFRYRSAQSGMYRSTSAALDSYDGGVGYVFMIAAWRPMRFDAFTDGTAWSSYELASLDYLQDPRPAVQELASLLVGDAREAYTLKFARYFDSQALYAGAGSGYSSLGFDYCAGAQPFGFTSPFFNTGLGGFGPFGSGFQYGYNFTRRGTAYYYDQAGDCYRTGSPYSFGYGGFRIAQTPGIPPIIGRPRKFDLDGHRSPLEPKVVVGHVMPRPQNATPAPTGEGAHFSPEYRQRGLITAEDPSSGGPVRRPPRMEPQAPVGTHVRPSIDEMTSRRAENTHEGTPAGMVRAQQGAGAETPTYRGRMQGSGANGTANPGAGVEQRTHQRPETHENPRAEQPVRSEPSPRTPPPERTAPPPRMQAPERPASPPPPPRAEAPASRPSSPPPSAPPSSTPVKPPTA
ncbi:MAG: hypothetical protein ABJF01_19390 [bacterium]